MKEIIKQTPENFLRLVRLGVGHKAKPLRSPVDWDEVEVLAIKQGLWGVVLDGVQRLAESADNADTIPYKKKLEWLGQVMQGYELRYREYRNALAKLAAFYNSHGYKMMVLKGYACGLNWPKIEHRPYGDIDIWMFGRQKEADALIESLEFKVRSSSSRAIAESLESVDSGEFKVGSIKVDKSHHHHTVFNWMGFTVENHYDFENVHHHKSSLELEKVFKELGKDDSHFVEIEGASTGSATRIYLPSPNHHALLLLKNSMTDFAAFYVTLRHVLDWGFHVEKYGKEIDWEWLEGVVEQYHMTDYYNCINAICVEDLGFQLVESLRLKVESQLESAEFRKLKERVLADILEPKFSRVPPDKRFLPKAWYMYRRWKGNEWKHKMCYNESMWSAFWSGMRNHLVKPKV